MGGLLALAAAGLLAAAPFGPPEGPLRLSGGFGTGQVQPPESAHGGDTEDHLRTGHVTAEWLFPAFRLGLGYRGVVRDVERRCTPVAGERTPGRCPQGGASGRETDHTATGSVGFGAGLYALSVGLAFRHSSEISGDGASSSDSTARLAGSARLGPSDLVCARASLNDAGPETPGQGELRMGLEVTPGAGRVLLGALREGETWGLLLSGQLKLGGRVALAVSGAAHPTSPARLVLVGFGVVLDFEP